MINFVNSDLFNFRLKKEVDPRTNREYQKIQVLTSDKLVQPRNSYMESSDTRYGAPYQNGVVNRGDVLKPISMELFRISAPIANYDDVGSDENLRSRVANIQFPMSIFATYRNPRRPRIEVRCHRNGEDHTNLFVVAFPFNGMLQKLTVTKAIRIYSGAIQTSKKPFFYRSHKYRKILYLIIEVNKKIFEEDHPYHADFIDLNLESFAFITDRETEEQKTKHETMRVRFLPDADFDTVWTEETLDERVDKHVEPDEDLWPIFRLDRKDVAESQPTSKRQNSKKRFQPPVRYEGNMEITHNRHGIRVERTIRNPPYRKDGGGFNKRDYRPRDDHQPRPHGPRYGYDSYPQKDLDQMIKDSGMNDRRNLNRSKKNGGKPNHGRRGGKR